MRRKFVFIFLIIILCSGCRAEYNLTINDDLSVEENVLATEDSAFFEEYEKSSIGRVVGFILEPYLNTLNENKYTTNSYITSGRSGVTISKRFNSIEEYANSTIFASQYTDKVNYNKDGNNITLSVKGRFSKADQDQTRFPIEEAAISIRLPFKVIDHNADKVDDDVYTWLFDKNDTEERDIKITFDGSKVHKPFNYWYIGIVIGIIILLIILFMVYNKIKIKRTNVNEI